MIRRAFDCSFEDLFYLVKLYVVISLINYILTIYLK